MASAVLRPSSPKCLRPILIRQHPSEPMRRSLWLSCLRQRVAWRSRSSKFPTSITATRSSTLRRRGDCLPPQKACGHDRKRRAEGYLTMGTLFGFLQTSRCRLGGTIPTRSAPHAIDRWRAAALRCPLGRMPDGGLMNGLVKPTNPETGGVESRGAWRMERD
jgi:hypothetical protein